MKRTKPIRPLLLHTDSWENLEQQFSEGLDGPSIKMLELIKHIRVSGLSKRLYANTSLDRLLVCNYEPMEWQKEMLFITFELGNNTWNFSYFGRKFQDPQFVRTYDADKGVEKFKQFIEWVRW